MSEPGVHKGAVAEKIGYGGAARAAEDVMVARDCMLALHTGASVCIQHISSENSVELVRLAKKLGADVHAEATPHHFTLTEEAVLKYGTMARMNPPLRTEADRQAIIEGIKDGTIDMIVTDHAPHSAEEKARPMAQAPSGITGLETSLALGIHSLVEPGYITLMDLMRLMSKAPAEFYRMVPGSITEGAPADLVIFGEHEQWTVDHFDSKAENSPFKGWTLPGKSALYHLCRQNRIQGINKKKGLPKRQSLFIEKYLWIFFLIFQKMHIEMHVFLILRIQFIIGFYKLAVLIRYDITAAMEKFVQRNMVIAAELDCCIKIRKPSAGLIAGIYLSGDMKFFAECCLRKSGMMPEIFQNGTDRAVFHFLPLLYINT